jgi:peptidoglycan/LPS O-acetylase OafA/YrhL
VRGTLELRHSRDFERDSPTDGISRPIGNVRRFPAFDGLRAFAAVSVVAVHSAIASGFSSRSGYGIYTARLEIGVAVFFVISGFLLYRPFAVAHLSGRSAPEAGKFWIRRLARIIPAYWLALTVIVYVLHDATLPGGWSGILVNYLFLQIYVPGSYFAGIPQAWSLCTEMSFYLVLPLYAAAIAYRRTSPLRQLRRELCGLLALVAVSVLFRSLVLSHHPHCTQCLANPPLTATMQAWLPSLLDLFAVGMLLAVLSAWFAAHRAEPSWLRHRAMPWVSWGLAIVVFWSVSHIGLGTQAFYSVTPAVNILRQTLYGLFALFLVAPAVFGPQEEGAIRRFLRLTPIAWLGVVSYGIYLWHVALIEQVLELTGRAEYAIPFWELFLTLLALSTIVATVSYLGLEQPILEFANRVTRGRAAAADDPEPVVALPVRGDAPRGKPKHLRAPPAGLAWRWQAWRDSLGARWFLPGLSAITVAAIAVRAVFAVGWTFGKVLPSDATFFHQTAASLVSGRGYAVASYIPPHKVLPAAAHPPLFSMVLATFDALGFHSVDAQRVVLGVVASLAVFLTGLLGHRVSGPVVGLVAAGLAAVDPLWFQSSAVLMSESIYLVVIAGTLLLALRCLDRANRWSFVFLGGAIGLAALTRSEALLLLLFLAVPVVLFAARSGRQRLALARCLLAGLLVVLLPWLVRNELQMGGLTLSTDQGVTLAGSYCPATMQASNINYGGFDALCAEDAAAFLIEDVPPPDHAKSWTELTVSNTIGSSTQTYARAHLGALPGLALARVENTWGLARTNQQVFYDAVGGGANPSADRFGLELGRVLLAFEAVGVIILARRSLAPFSVLAAPLLVITVNSAIFYGATRFLTAAQPSLAVFAAIGLAAIVKALARRLRREPPVAPEEPAMAQAGSGAPRP